MSEEQSERLIGLSVAWDSLAQRTRLEGDTLLASGEAAPLYIYGLAAGLEKAAQELRAALPGAPREAPAPVADGEGTRVFLAGVEIKVVKWTPDGMIYQRSGTQGTAAMSSLTWRRLVKAGLLRVEGSPPDWTAREGESRPVLSALAARVLALEEENARLRHKMDRARRVVELIRKVAGSFGRDPEGPQTPEGEAPARRSAW